MKKVRNAIIFIIIFLIIFQLINNVLSIKPNAIHNFYKEPKNSFDVVYIGASNAYQHFNSVLAYHEYGFTTGLMSSDTQPIQILKYMLKEAQKRQKPKVYVIDLGHLYYFENNKVGGIHKVIDEMPFSFNKLAITKKLLESSNINKKDYINYYFNFLMYHSSWKTALNNLKNNNLYKGYLLEKYNTKIDSQEKLPWDYEVSSLNQIQEAALQETIDYIKEQNLEVLFTVPIKTYDQTFMGYINAAMRMIEENNLKIINFNTIDELEIDFSHDLYDYEHLNVWGATKYTRYFAKYLHENYDLKDHRQDKKYISWSKEYDRFTKSLKELIGESIDEI